jgi:heat shock protein HslJ
MRWAAALAAVVTVTMTATGCARDGVPGAGGDPLAGRAFLSESVTQDGAPVSLVDGTRISLRFGDDGNLTADAGCNTLFAEVSTAGGRLTTTGVGSTEMGCDQPRHAQDSWLATLLSDGPAWELAGDRLTLTRDTTVLILRDREVADPDRPLAGTRWLVDTMVTGDAASSLPAGTEGAAWLVIQGDTFTAHTACRDLHGRVDIAGSTVHFKDVVQADPACTPELADLDTLIIRVLTAQDVTYAVVAARLHLDHPDGIGLGLHADG